jgi:Domain of unknown function (DUF1707)
MVMARPGDERAAGTAGHGRLRASHADREQVVDTLKAAFVQGMLAKDEFDVRVGQTFASRTHAELAAVTVDIPAALIRDQPPRKPGPAQGRPPMRNVTKVGICVVIAVVVMAAGMFVTDGAALRVFASFYSIGLLIAGAQMLDSRYEKKKRSRGQLPPRPGDREVASEGPSRTTPPAAGAAGLASDPSRPSFSTPLVPGWA